MKIQKNRLSTRSRGLSGMALKDISK
ncbi:unnamed protein product, partial [Rotaria sp. Silwood2]